MTLFLAVAVLVILGIALSVMRRTQRDRRSTRNYHRALDMLGQINQQQAGSHGAGAHDGAGFEVYPSYQADDPRSMADAAEYPGEAEPEGVSRVVMPRTGDRRLPSRNGRRGDRQNGRRSHDGGDGKVIGLPGGDSVRILRASPEGSFPHVESAPIAPAVWSRRSHAPGRARAGDPEVADPGVTAPELAGPDAAGLEVAGLEVAGPDSACPEAADAGAPGPEPVDPETGGPEPVAGDSPLISIPSNATRHRLDELGRVTEVPVWASPAKDPTSPGITVRPPRLSEPGSVPVFGDPAEGVVPAGYAAGVLAGDVSPELPSGEAPGSDTWRPTHLQRRNRLRLAVTAAAAVTVIGGGGAAVATLAGSSGRNPATAGGKHATGGHLRPAAVTQPTTPTTAPVPSTTVAPPFKLVSTTVDLTTYQLSGTGPITITASGPCWVEVRQTNADGATVYTATMQAGQTETVNGPAWVRLGAPRVVTITVAGTAVPPVANGGPYDLEFQ